MDGRLHSTEMRTLLKYNLLIGTVADRLRNFGFHKMKEFLKYVNHYELCK